MFRIAGRVAGEGRDVAGAGCLRGVRGGVVADGGEMVCGGIWVDLWEGCWVDRMVEIIIIINLTL